MKTSTIFKGVMKTYEKGTGLSKRTVSYCDERATHDAITKLLKKNGVKGVVSHYTDDETGKKYSASYYISVTRIDSYGDGMQYRVYFGLNSNGRQTFIASDKEGNIEIKKLVAKVKERFEDDQRYENRQEEKSNREKKEKSLAEKLTKKLEGTGFKVEKDWAGFEVVADIYDQEELEAMVEKLVKAFKK